MKKDKAINLAIDNVIKEGLTDIFDRPFEVDFLNELGIRKEVFNEVLTSLKDYDLSNLKINPLEYVLMPKNEMFDFRRCALIQPLDTIKYTSLVLIIADEIEKKRVMKRRKKVFSYRFKPENGYLFDKKYNFTSFRSYVSEKTKQDKVKVLVECDISNFYDRLNLHRLESILRSIEGIDDKVIKLLNELLIFWSNRDSYGLPVGCNASRILAEASLIEVDNFLLSKDVEFTRFVDDYRLFAPNARIANRWLSLLIKKLNEEGLFLNTKKTVFKDVSNNKKGVLCNDEKLKSELNNKNIVSNKDELEIQQSMRVMSSYSGTIPRKFREATEKEIDEIKTSVNIEKLFLTVEGAIIINPADFKLLIKSIIYLERYEYLEKVPDLLEKAPQFIPYFIDVLIKYEEKIPDEMGKSIKEKFSKWFEENELPEYILIYIARLLGNKKYQNIDILFNSFINLKRNAGSYIGRVLLEELQGNLERGRVIEIKGYYLRSNMWEKRQITNIINSSLFEDEKRPWLKNVEINSNDIFEKGIFKKYKPNKNKRVNRRK
ncbi:RNA-directed DNA polymerase [Sporanaerobacter acetigenes]|uniref:RNA-directed DNA polymerase n=1 Tax=Sporanaerobacter acetigenes TaxID=165813 RepID=UPI00331913B1